VDSAGGRVMVTRDSGGAPRVYIVLVNWNGADDTIECLDSLFDLDYSNFRVVVCDNASTDGSVERIRRWALGEESFSRPDDTPLPGREGKRFPLGIVELDRAAAEDGEGADEPLTVIRTGDNLGFAGGNNVGLCWVQARGDAQYVWLLNNDTVVQAEALSELVAALEADRDLGAAGSKLLLYGEPRTLQVAGGGPIRPWQGLAVNMGEFEPDDGKWDQPSRLDCIVGASLCIRTAALCQVGLLDERYFMYSEEMDWCIRLRRAGWSLAYTPGSRVWHKVNRSVGGASPMRDYFAVRSSLLWVRKFYPWYLPIAMLYGLYRYVLPKLVRREFRRIGAVIQAHIDFLAGSSDRSYR
jgi:GT2 family glycosyltransferase